mmetsp:Transcript_13818/g.36728  ORF Transcript_13818/g.36728 Transcript_13818/m.36728 type:complete len:247 (-) Transcript_13818:822-1562(-)
MMHERTRTENQRVKNFWFRHFAEADDRRRLDGSPRLLGDSPMPAASRSPASRALGPPRSDASSFFSTSSSLPPSSKRTIIRTNCQRASARKSRNSFLLLSKGQSTSQQLRQLLLLQVVRVDAALLPDVVSEGGLRRQVELVLQASDLRLQVPVVAVRRHLLRVRGVLLGRDLCRGRRRDHEDLAEFRLPPRAHRGRPTRGARARGIAAASVLGCPGRGRGRRGGDPPPRQSAYRGRDGLLLPSSRR